MKRKQFRWVMCKHSCLNQDSQASSIFAGLYVIIACLSRGLIYLLSCLLFRYFKHYAIFLFFIKNHLYLYGFRYSWY